MHCAILKLFTEHEVVLSNFFDDCPSMISEAKS